MSSPAKPEPDDDDLIGDDEYPLTRKEIDAALRPYMSRQHRGHVIWTLHRAGLIVFRS